MALGARDSVMTLLGRGYDLRKWFRQVPMATTEIWKCVVHANGGFRENSKMKMGRAMSRHSGQRTSLLIAHVLQAAAADEEWSIVRNTPEDSDMGKLVRWIDTRRRPFQRTVGKRGR